MIPHCLMGGGNFASPSLFIDRFDCEKNHTWENVGIGANSGFDVRPNMSLTP